MSKTVELPFRPEDMRRRAREAFRDESYDWTEVLKVMTEAMESHPFWKRLEGTPLENDLPVRAAKAFFNIVKDDDRLSADVSMEPTVPQPANTSR